MACVQKFQVDARFDPIETLKLVEAHVEELQGLLKGRRHSLQLVLCKVEAS